MKTANFIGTQLIFIIDDVSCSEEVLFIYQVLIRHKYLCYLRSIEFYPLSQMVVVEAKLDQLSTITWINKELKLFENRLNFMFDRKEHNKIQVTVPGF